MQIDESTTERQPSRTPWNKGKLIGAKPPLKAKHVWSIRTKLQIEGRARDRARFNLAIDSKRRKPQGRGRCIRTSLRSRDRASEEDWTACQVRADGADPRSG
jgi:hypothetical protein